MIDAMVVPIGAVIPMAIVDAAVVATMVVMVTGVAMHGVTAVVAMIAAMVAAMRIRQRDAGRERQTQCGNDNEGRAFHRSLLIHRRFDRLRRHYRCLCLMNC
jgi:hypothetical protein